MKARVVFLDYLRVGAIFMVLLIHACEQYYLGATGLAIACPRDAVWVTAIDSICRAAVPLFVMTSAYLLFPVTRPTGEFLRRRFLRVGIPFAIWAIVYTLRYGGDFAPLLFNFPSATGGHLWFVPMIFGVYLAMPILSPWAERLSARELKVWIGVWLFTTLFPFLRYAEGLWVGAPDFGAVPYLYGECPWNAFGMFHYVSGFFGYLLLGFWFRKFGRDLTWGQTLARAIPLGLVGWLIVGGIFFARIPDAGGYPVSEPYACAVRLEMSWEYCSLGVALTVIAWFLLFRKFTASGRIHSALVRPLAEASFGVYLVHILILLELAPLVRAHLANPAAIVVLAAATFALSSLAVLLLRRIPKLGAWVAGMSPAGQRKKWGIPPLRCGIISAVFP